MSLRKRKIFKKASNDEDPMSGIANMTDVMLVLAVGFLIFAIMSMNMQSVIFSDSTPQEKQRISEAIKKAVNVETAQDYNGTADISSGESSGMENMGTVYKDPETGKLIMIPPSD
ncbi:DUF2149 domain-containing protein [Methanobrevibacter curvatus]|uniref:DUF2149 domain-containing protein n=1 Tax=Methanobrevibacter curvatus TaxID=49547 RepID=A0A166DRC1_9EURY|nr:DUF2149 domain-containing protein [Methanobrevibacter curvatus]KZX15873.1 hypothetical protein MBCUR_01850 [Methanobrevibacter curvatus]